MDDITEVYLEETIRGDEWLILQRIFIPFDTFDNGTFEAVRPPSKEWFIIPGGRWRRQLPGDA